ncbi:lanthionine synthetase LanC family protein [Pedobacter mendelii]|uniref:Lanthionine synthetase C-like protein n=1 Tax=Pedobacter mendelii TaxID=1908240 RepID=A0ABQ2BH63_9SPHI|nr:lanthionine synthetase LanC family protein [Pedobacter mendelii]GGI23297.1 hypothetical protein GCM10008119_06940 [Pedobacter mendelii]
MFNQKQQKELRQYLDQIEEEIMANMLEDDNGPYWLVPYYPTPTAPYAFKQSSEIFNGDCGIALFFLAYYSLYEKPEHLLLAKQIYKRVRKIEAAKHPKFFCLYSGVTDWIYMALHLFEVTGDMDYLEEASAIANQHLNSIVNKVTKFDLLSGHAGNLLVLCKLYSYHQHPDVLRAIHSVIDYFIADARVSERGLKWEHDKYAYDSLAGFSHGASGIAFALMQAGKFLGYEGLVYLAEEALAYEMLYYDYKANNWLDLRLGFMRLNLPNAHTWDIQIFLPHISNVNSWAHGAAGVGLARLYAYEATGEKSYLTQAKHALMRCKSDIKSNRTDYTLCTGFAGYTSFLLNYQQQIADKDIPETLMTIARNAFKLYALENTFNTFIETNQADFGLFSGKTGIGYMLISVLSDQKAPDILYPSLPLSKVQLPVNNRYSSESVAFNIYSRYFSKTIAELKKYEIKLSKIYCSNINLFGKTILRVAQQNTSGEEFEYIADVLNLELKIVEIWKMHKGALCIAKRNERLLGKCKFLSALDDEKLLHQTFSLTSNIELHDSYYNPDDTLSIVEKVKVRKQIILLQKECDIAIIYPGKWATFLLSQLTTPTNGYLLFENVLLELDRENVDEKEKDILSKKITLQLRIFIQNGLVEINDKIPDAD